jgi:hypothetical protein
MNGLLFQAILADLKAGERRELGEVGVTPPDKGALDGWLISD